MMKRVSLVVLVLLMGTAVGAIQKERVFGPEVPTGRYKHPASITELENGDLYLAYYGGDGEYAPGTAVYGARLPKGSTKWNQPVMLAQDPFNSVGNGVVWQAPDGLVWLFYVVRYGDTWSDSRIAMKVSKDGANTWSDASMLTIEKGTMVQGRPFTLMNGDYMLPVYFETGHDREQVGAESASFFLRYSPKTGEWKETGRIYSERGNIQPIGVQIDENYLIAYCRRGGGYGRDSEGYVVRSESRDGGETWSPGKDSEFPNPNAAVAFLKLTNGHLVLFYNNSMSRRTPLTAAISTDTDRSYPHRCDIGTGNNSFAYPYAIQAKDGTIHLIHTSDGRSVIHHLWFTEEDLLECGK